MADSMVVTSLAYVLSFRRARQCAAVQAVAVGRRCAREQGVPVESREDIEAGAEEIVDISEPGEETEPAPI